MGKHLPLGPGALRQCDTSKTPCRASKPMKNNHLTPNATCDTQKKVTRLPQPEGATMHTILSIRGGGIRGIIPCCCLMKLESQLGGVTRDHIDFCAGTSTAALLKVYTDGVAKIFKPTGTLAQIKRGVKGFMYDPKNLYNVLHDVLGAQAAWTINDSPIRVMISATAMDGHNWFFVKDNPKNAKTTGSVKLTDAAVASSSAPTFFDHWTINGIAGQAVTFYDGGVGGTANPAYQACVEAFEFDSFKPADTRLVALGT